MKHPGMTLAEILIALVILALIATVTIPKVFDAGNNTDEDKWINTVKDVITELQAAYGQYRLNNRVVSSTFTAGDLLPYLNYVKQDTVRSYDVAGCGSGSNTCSSAGKPCLIFKNGASMEIDTTESFNGTGRLNAIKVKIDPDGKVTGGSGDEGKMVVLYLYYTGRVKTRGQIDAGTTSSNWTDGPMANCDPDWWSWD